MKSLILRRLDTFARQLTPLAVTILLLLVGIVPLRIPALELLTPSLPLIAVFYWTLYRPDLMPAPAVFGIGLLQDALQGSPIGITALIYVLLHIVMTTQRRHVLGKPFVLVWLGFTMVTVAAFLLSWLIASAYYGRWLGGTPLLPQALATVGVFPLVVRLLLRCQLALQGRP